MPGDYLHMKRTFKDGHAVDPGEANEALQPAAERVNGLLNQHNFRAPLPPTVASGTATFFRSEERHVAVDSQMAHLAKAPDPFAAGAFTITQETSWQMVQGPDPGRDMRVEIDSGASNLILTAHAAHCYAGKEDGVHAVVKFIVSEALRRDNYRVSLELNGVFFVLTLDIRVKGYEGSRGLAFYIAQGGNVPSGDVDWAARGWIARSNGRTVLFRKIDDAVISTSVSASVAGSGYLANGISAFLKVQGAPGLGLATLSVLTSNYTVGAEDAIVFYPAQIQYAYRVDGAIITPTITGRFDNEQLSYPPRLIVDPKADAATSTPIGTVTGVPVSPALNRFGDRPDAMNRPMHAARITATVAVEPGRHIVELVARRVPCGRGNKFVTGDPGVGTLDSQIIPQPTDNRIIIYNRQLLVTDNPVEPVGSTLFGDDVSAAPLEDEDVLSRASLITDRIQPIIDAYNDIEEFQVARGAFNGDHMEGYSSVLALAQRDSLAATAFDSGTNLYSYPTGASTSLDFFTKYKLYPQGTWKDLLTTSLTVPVVATFGAPVQCVITVEANVALQRLRSNISQNEIHLGAAAFAIGLYVDPGTGGRWVLWPASVVWANSNDYFAHQPDKTTKTLTLHALSEYASVGGADPVDIPVTASFVLNDPFALVANISRVGLFGSALHMGTAAGAVCSVKLDRCSINAVVVKS
jgi:hypothetical protein